MGIWLRSVRLCHARSRFSLGRDKKNITLLILTLLAITGVPSLSDCQPLVTLNPGDNIQAEVDSHPPYTRFFLTRGTYRLQQVSPKDGQQFIGELGPRGERLAVFNGARVLLGWNSAGSGVWYVTGQTQQQDRHGVCQNRDYPVCEFAEELFIDGEHRTQVLSRAELEPGKWFFDYDADRIYVAEWPYGKLIETSVADRAFVGPADEVVIRNLVVEKYATRAQHGAIDSREHNSAPVSTGVNWLVENNETRWNHGIGIRVTNGGLVQGNHSHHNGQAGVKAVGTGATFINNEIAYNNFADFRRSYEAGGGVFGETTDLTLAYNYVHHNEGPGLWADADCLRTTFLGNRIEFNGNQGISYEISYEAWIEGNLLVGNGFFYPSWGWGGGIVISGSPDVSILDNIVVDNADGIVGIQQDRGDGLYGPHVLENMYVSGNCTKQLEEGWTGVLNDIPDEASFCCRNNVYENNKYDLPDPDDHSLSWNFHRMGLSEWRTYHSPDELAGSCDVSNFRELIRYEDFEAGQLESWARVVQAD